MSVSLRTPHEASFTLRSFAAGLYQVYYTNNLIVVTRVSGAVGQSQKHSAGYATTEQLAWYKKDVPQCAYEDIIRHERD